MSLFSQLCHYHRVVCLESPPSPSSLPLISQDHTLPSPSRTKAPLGRGRNTGLMEHHLLLWYGQGMTPRTWMDVPAMFNSTIRHHADFNAILCNTDDHHEIILLYPTRLNSDDHEPPVHHIALRHWTFPSTLSTPTL